MFHMTYPTYLTYLTGRTLKEWIKYAFDQHFHFVLILTSIEIKEKMDVIPSALDKRKYILTNDGETLTIFNLTKKDIMNVQCNVSNVHGYIYADSYLNVVCEYTNNFLCHLCPLKAREWGH